MNAKYFLKSTLAILLLGASTSLMAYDKKPEICNGVKITWDAMTRKFTIKNLPTKGIQEPWICYLTDASWCKTCYVDITPYGTYTPGAATATYLSSRLGTSYGDPLKNGANGSSAAFMALKTTENDLPKGAKSEDCNQTCDGNCLADKCKGVVPTYCDNYNATFEGSKISVSGIFNCVPDNIYAVAPLDWSKWALVPIKVDPTDPNKGTADVSELTYNASSEKVYPYGEGVVFHMNADDKGGGAPGRGPNFCPKQFSPTSSGIATPIITSLSIYPNPASAGQLITVKGTFDAQSQVLVYNATGALISTILPSITSEGLQFAVPEHATAINFVKVVSGNETYSGKLSVK